MKYPHLKKAPIAEAVIDFRFQPALNIEHDKIAAIHESIISEYPVKQENKEMKLGFVVGPDQTTQQTVSDSVIGYRFESADGKYVFVAGKNGFSLSKLAPYENWDKFLAEALKISEVYFGVLGHQDIVRTAVRYINVIEIEEKTFDFDDYLAAGPKIPEGLPDTVSEFLIRNTIPYVDDKSLVTIIQGFGGSKKDEPIKVILDIDAVCFESYDSKTNKHIEKLSLLHDIKNQAFFKSLLSKALDKYK